jgi:CIC family chloride channel protein
VSTHLKAAVGGLLLGVAGYLLYRLTGHYYLFGVGYSFITDMLTSAQPLLPLVILLIVLKIAATSLTLGAGGSGGVFAPSLFIGAAIGGATGMICHHFFPSLTAPASAYALVGMAAMVAGTTGATFTAIVMTFEMTRNYAIMLPLMLSVVAANYIVRALYKETIYTKKLSRRGVHIQFDKLISIFRMTLAKSVMDPNIISVRPSDTVGYTIAKGSENQIATIPVIDGDQMLGIVHCTEIFTALPNEPIAAYIRKGDLSIPQSIDCMDALEKMDAANSNLLLLKGESGFEGIITKRAILREYFRKKRMIM